MGIGERAFQGVIFARERFAELFEAYVENFQTAGIMLPQSGFAAYQVDRGAFLGSRFSQEQGAVGKIERGLAVFAGDLRTLGLPVKPPGDHQMNNEIEIVFQLKNYTFSKPPDR